MARMVEGKVVGVIAVTRPVSVPNFTVEPVMKPEPVIVTEVPPTVEPFAGVILETTGSSGV